MKFGQVEDPSIIDFSMPPAHSDTLRVLSGKPAPDFEVSVGCAKWNKTDLKGFYPRGTKDELSYYATQFNAIELNATFYSMPSVQQVETWRDKTPADFKFFPKITNTVSHYRRLIDVDEIVTQYATSVLHFDEKLGMVFLQLHDNFKPKNFDRLEHFIQKWPQEVPLAVELRNETWFSDPEIFEETCQLFKRHQITNIIVDTAGRRDMMHMRLTTPTAFIRYVGANADSDYSRLEAWVDQIVQWRAQGLERLYFFVHQNIEKASPLLSAYFIERLNRALGLQLHLPQMATPTPTLF
ncbi:DUF72 domain-containing protein [Riemerella columbina]|uniref:DUF72 domain-containing protein n=1 Tax=Riemerella columbina TaxID=103810 RepID=UPI00267020A6|nr:DUF72 domain-containing protein [Riemerella columbina]WKS94948.1 DUF72 domain-containing protein [Riemerella columbina]